MGVLRGPHHEQGEQAVAGFEGKIAIGVPHLGPIRPYFFDTMVNLSIPGREQTYLVRVEDKPIDIARNMIVETALADPKTTHVFFMDSDMQFPAHALLRLIRDAKPVVGGTYFARGGKPTPHAYRFHHEDEPDGTCPLGKDHQGDGGKWYAPLARDFAAWLRRNPSQAEYEAAAVLPATPDALVKCDAIATGAMLIERRVLEAIRDAHPGERRPWFRSHLDTGGGEDFFFCEQARAAGFDVWVDFGVQCAHEFRHAWIDRSDFADFFKVGTDEEHDFGELELDVAPQQMEPARNPLVEVAG